MPFGARRGGLWSLSDEKIVSPVQGTLHPVPSQRQRRVVREETSRWLFETTSMTTTTTTFVGGPPRPTQDRQFFFVGFESTSAFLPLLSFSYVHTERERNPACANQLLCKIILRWVLFSVL